MEIRIVSMENVLNTKTLEVEVGLKILFKSDVFNDKEVISLVGTYFKDGSIDKYPSLHSIEDSPLYYIHGGKVLDFMYSFEGDVAKSVFSKLCHICEDYNLKLESIYKSDEYLKLLEIRNSKIDKLNSLKENPHTSSKELSRLVSEINILSRKLESKIEDCINFKNEYLQSVDIYSLMKEV